MPFRTIVIGWVIFLCFSIDANTQDVETEFNQFKKKWKENPISFNGFFKASGQFYNSTSEFNRALPFTGNIFASLNLNILGIQTPFSLAYSNGGIVFDKRLPSYRFIGLSPKYKWATLHVGNRQMNLGKYTFSHHNFEGIGIELNPSSWKIQSFYGRLRRARIEDLNTIQNIESFYKRMGTGLKLAYSMKKDELALSLFQAWDESDKTKLNISPSENFILSFQTRKSLFQDSYLEIEYAHSFFNSDINFTPGEPSGSNNFYRIFNFNNPGINRSNAFKTGFFIDLDKLKIDLSYERIDPNFRTMGALFFQNDLENLTIGSRFRIWKNKINIQSRLGVQKNNLNDFQANAYQRIVGSMNFNAQINNRINAYASISNFNHVNRRRSFIDPNNPILLTELVLNNYNSNVGAYFLLKANSIKQSSLQLNMNYATGNTIENDQVNLNLLSSTTNAYAHYSILWKPSEFTMGVNASFQQNRYANTKNQFSLLSLIASKKLVKAKIRLESRITGGYNQQIQDSEPMTNGMVWNFLTTAQWNWTESSSLNYSFQFIHNNVKSKPAINSDRFSELRSLLAIQHRFNALKK